MPSVTQLGNNLPLLNNAAHLNHHFGTVPVQCAQTIFVIDDDN